MFLFVGGLGVDVDLFGGGEMRGLIRKVEGGEVGGMERGRG